MRDAAAVRMEGQTTQWAEHPSRAARAAATRRPGACARAPPPRGRPPARRCTLRRHAHARLCPGTLRVCLRGLRGAHVSARPRRRVPRRRWQVLSRTPGLPRLDTNGRRGRQQGMARTRNPRRHSEPRAAGASVPVSTRHRTFLCGVRRPFPHDYCGGTQRV